MPDDASLMKLGRAFTIELELESEDPEKYPIAPKRRIQRSETVDSDILAVNVPDGKCDYPIYRSFFVVYNCYVAINVHLKFIFCFRGRQYSQNGGG